MYYLKAFWQASLGRELPLWAAILAVFVADFFNHFNWAHTLAFNAVLASVLLAIWLLRTNEALKAQAPKS